MHRGVPSAIAAWVLAAWPAAATAAAVQVNPTRVDLSPDAKSAMVSLRNTASEPVAFEMHVRAWKQSASGEMELSATDDVVAYPLVVSIGPGEERNVRVGVVRADLFGPTERGYRLLVQELETPEKQGAPMHLRVLTQLNIPVFLAPSRAVERAVIEEPRAQEGRVAFTVRNVGTVHLRADSLKLAARGEDGAALVERDLAPWYLLPGGARSYDVEIPRQVCARVREVAVASALGRETLRASTRTPEGVCAR